MNFFYLVFREFKDCDIEEEIREAFRVFDREGNGFITVPDLMEVGFYGIMENLTFDQGDAKYWRCLVL